MRGEAGGAGLAQPEMKVKVQRHLPLPKRVAEGLDSAGRGTVRVPEAPAQAAVRETPAGY